MEKMRLNIAHPDFVGNPGNREQLDAEVEEEVQLHFKKQRKGAKAGPASRWPIAGAQAASTARSLCGQRKVPLRRGSRDRHSTGHSSTHRNRRPQNRRSRSIGRVGRSCLLLGGRVLGR